MGFDDFLIGYNGGKEMSEVTWVEVTIMHETDMAVLISQDPESEETNMAKWIPKSQISDS
ncbi:hypothetical protein LCGC14_0739760, partial [marine sediment metagenome]